MAESVGQIGLDLVVNQNGFNRQMVGITGLAKKAGVALASAFAVKKLIDFGRSCIDLGSNLSEIQNVVDTAFPTMTGQIEKFANAAIDQFGLSQTVAKKYSSTFGAMAQSFGFTEKQAYDMSTALTGLSGDVASFYNISSDEAYTKLKSVFTGETETLKELGVVMTQSALDQYAMANGFGKITKSMSEQEKVALRLAFVQDKLKMASGDFAKTQNSWANQTRILSLRWQEFKATIGQGLINLFTPILGVINKVLAGLSTLANGFKAFTELITGNKSSSGSGVGKVASDATAATTGLEGASGAADGLSKATDGVGKSAKKAAKDMKSLMSFDELNILDKNDNSDSDSGSGANGSGGSDALNGASVDYGKLAEGENRAFSSLEGTIGKVIARFKELANLFNVGFKIGLGDTSQVFADIHANIGLIKGAFIDIFNDGTVFNAMQICNNKIAESLGEFAGSMASIGLTIVDNLTGGLGISLQEQAPRIKEWLISMFDITGNVNQIMGNFSAVVADIATVFRSPQAQQITADIITIFSDAFMHVTEITGKEIKNILNAITIPIINNKEPIKAAIEGTLNPISKTIGSIKEFIVQTFSNIRTMYDEKITPMWEAITRGLDKMVKALLKTWNENVLPVLNWLAEKVDKLIKEHLEPLYNEAIKLFGKVAEGIGEIWEKVLAPFYEWFANNIAPIFITVIGNIAGKFLDLMGVVSDVVKGLIKALGGVVDFIVGVFTGNWSKAWNGIKNIFKGVWDSFVSIAKTPINIIIGMINGLIKAVNTCISGLNKFSFSTPDWLPPPLGGKSFGFNIPTIGSVPYLAKGGIVSTPTLAMVGEQGKEAVVPLENNTEWMDKVGTVVANAVISAMQFGGNNNNNNNKSGDIILQVDGTTFARVINPFCHKENDRMGTKMIIKPV